MSVSMSSRSSSISEMTRSKNMFAAGFIAGLVQFGLAILAFGGWNAFFSHRALLAMTVITLAMLLVALFSGGNLSSGEQEDRGNRWVFIAFAVIALASAIVPPYADRIGLWTIDGETTRWLGLIPFIVGGVLRLWPVFVLGPRFSGLVAIQPGHTLETHGVYALVRNPSYLGMIINMAGWALVFRGWTGLVLTVLLLVPIIPRIRAEERLLRTRFGAEYDAYVGRTWRLVPWFY
jgi:protein-S-isoprenylcysteine O-methyltransferase Ste14